MRGFRSYLAVGALVGAYVAAAEPAPQAPAAGPVRVDMTLEAARKALPQAAWRDIPSTYTGKTIAIQAPAAWTLDGQAYLLKLSPMRSGAATLRIESETTGIDIDACRTRTLALAAHLSAYFADIKDRRWTIPSNRPAPSATISVQRTPDGVPYVTAQPNFTEAYDYEDDAPKPAERDLETGRNARIAETVTAGGHGTWSYGQPATKAYPYSLSGNAGFRPADEDLGDSSRCFVSAIVRAEPWERAREEALDPAIKPLPLSARDLHTTLDGIDPPEAPVALAFRCEVERTSGKLFGCKSANTAQEKLTVMGAARRRLYRIAFETANLDPDSDIRLIADVTVTVQPTDRLSDEAFAALPPIIRAPIPKSSGPIIWAEAPTSAEISRYYPAAALRTGTEARATATCKITDDLRLACTSVETDPPGLAVFEDAVRKILKHFRAEPKLKTGAPAAGTAVKVPLRFRLED